MGITIEFYVGQAQDLHALLTLGGDDEYERLWSYPVADFSLHLVIPDDLDRLCQCLRKWDASIPFTFRELLVEQIWFDGSCESLTLLDDGFARALSRLNDAVVEELARDWMVPFAYSEPFHQTPAFQAMLQLRNIAQVAVARKDSLFLYLLGLLDPRWWRV